MGSRSTRSRTTTPPGTPTGGAPAGDPVVGDEEDLDAYDDDLVDALEPADDRDIDHREKPVAARARHRGAWIEMMISSLLSLVASFVLSVDAIELARNPAASFSCDISEKISCSQVGLSWQAQVFGFPNAFLGLIFEPIVITICVASLGGVRFPRWFMLTAQGVYLIAIGFAYWLFTQAYFVIGALCPWCLLVTVTTTLVFVTMTRINLLDRNFPMSDGTYRTVRRWLRLGADTWVAIILIGTIAAMVLAKYV